MEINIANIVHDIGDIILNNGDICFNIGVIKTNIGDIVYNIGDIVLYNVDICFNISVIETNIAIITIFGNANFNSPPQNKPYKISSLSLHHIPALSNPGCHVCRYGNSCPASAPSATHAPVSSPRQLKY